MGLSDEEKRLLREMEWHLRADDRHLGLILRIHQLVIAARPVITVLGLALGAVLMGVGIGRSRTAGTIIALTGFLVVLACTPWAVSLLRDRRRPKRMTESDR